MKVSDITEAALAFFVIGGIVTVAIIDVLLNRPVSIPAELYGFGGIIIGAYFRGRSTNGTIASLTTALQASVPANVIQFPTPPAPPPAQAA